MFINKVSACLIMLSVTIFPITGHSQTKKIEADRVAIIKADKEWLAVSKNAAAFVAATDKKFQLFPPNAPLLSDRKQIEDYWRSVIETPGLTLVWAPEGADVAASGDMGYSHGFYTLTTGAGSSNPVVIKGKYITVMRKQQNGQWRQLPISSTQINEEAKNGANK